MQIVRSQNGRNVIPLPSQQAGPVTLTLDADTVELLVATGFAEVWLAKEGHAGNVFINFLNKIEFVGRFPLNTLWGTSASAVLGSSPLSSNSERASSSVFPFIKASVWAK